MSNAFVLLLKVSCDVGCPADVLRNLTALKDMEATAQKRQFDRENKLVEMAEQEKQIIREEAERRLCAAKNEYFALKESAAQEVQTLKEIAEKTKAAFSTEFSEAREEWAREREKLQQQVDEGDMSRAMLTRATERMEQQNMELTSQFEKEKTEWKNLLADIEREKKEQFAKQEQGSKNERALWAKERTEFESQVVLLEGKLLEFESEKARFQTKVRIHPPSMQMCTYVYKCASSRSLHPDRNVFAVGSRKVRAHDLSRGGCTREGDSHGSS